MCYGIALCLVMKRDSDLYQYASWGGGGGGGWGGVIICMEEDGKDRVKGGLGWV